MSDELKSCPFCGDGSLLVIARRAAIYSLPDTKVFGGMVLCEECGGALRVCHMTRADTPDDIGERELRDTLRGRWNARAERTCHNLYHVGSSLGEGGFRCSLCDAEMEGDEPKSCPNCGAKVVW